MASSNFNKAQVGLQTAFGTAVTPTIQVPWRGTYEDKTQRHIAQYDSGQWTPTTIVSEVSYETAVTFEGTAFFELIPVLLNSGLADVAPTGSYIHNYWVNPAAVGTPKPLTALIGTVGTNLGVTGPAVKLKDLYLKTLTLSGNINDKAVSLKAEMFGTTYDDNTAAGFAFASVNLPATMEVINAMKGLLSYDDASTTEGPGETEGGITGLTPFSCTLLDWEFVLDTGIEPGWCLTDNVTSWSTLKYTSPSCTLKPIMRTSSTTYAQVKAKADAMTYQYLQLQLSGSSGRYLSLNLIGLWDTVPSVHDEQDGEVVMKPTFVCRTPHTQTTTPSWFQVLVNSTHNWT